MTGRVFGFLCVIGFVFAILSGEAEALGGAVLDGARGATDVTLSLCGMTCFWCGMMRVLSEAGVIGQLSRLLRPVLRPFFPTAAKTGEGLDEICANLSANLLGIGNAATPFALAAMQKLQRTNPCPRVATDEQITLAVLNTAGITLIPANLLALRRTAGSQNPYAVLVPVWIVSVCCCAMALLLCSLGRVFRRLSQKARGKYHA